MIRFLLLANILANPAALWQTTGLLLKSAPKHPASTHQKPLHGTPAPVDSKYDMTQLQQIHNQPDVPELPDEQAFESAEAYEQALAQWAELFPLDLNRATRHELLLLPALSPLQADAILAWREKHSFESTDDLAFVAELPEEVRQYILPWVTANPVQTAGNLQNAPIEIEHLYRLQVQQPLAEGYRGDEANPPHFTGSPLRMVQRHRIYKGPLSLALTRVKHPGEPSGLPWQTGSIAGHLQWHDEQGRFRLIAGDYTVRFGQGHALWSTPVMGKGSSPHRGPWRNAPGLSAYNASSRSGFLRGLALQVHLPGRSVLPGIPAPQRTLSIFASRLPRTATEHDDLTIRPPSGQPLFRTRSEVLRRHNSTEYLAGLHLRRQHQHWSSGITWYMYKMDRPVVPSSNQPALKNAPHQVVSVDVHLHTAAFELFGEGALLLQARPYRATPQTVLNQTVPTHADWRPGKSLPRYDAASGTVGIAGSIDGMLDWVLALRALGSGFWSEYGNAFRHGSGAATNQKGWYAGLRIRPYRKLVLGAYLDRFIPIERSGRHEGRPPGWDAMVQLRLGLHQTVQLHSRIRHVQQEQMQTVWPRTDSLEEPFSGLYPHLHSRAVRRSLNTHLEWKPTRSLRSVTYLYLVQNRNAQPIPLTDAIGQADIAATTHQSVLALQQPDYRPAQSTQSAEAVRQPSHRPAQSTQSVEAARQPSHRPAHLEHTGAALRQNLRWAVSPGLQFNLNMVLFDTDSYESRLYVFEQAMSQTMAARMLYGRGRQSGIAVRWEPVQGLLLETSYSLVYQYDRTSSGSGHDFSEGASRRFFGAQVRYRY